ncbi:MAG: alpha/beta hydrolase [Candidatus Obscuribacterales bacterium]|nr:alpha/beta hydrolase [Candidatus Obscuribacterales bacterium]
MKRKVEIVLQHGWAFDSSCWRGWMPHLRENPDYEISIQTPDRGYFGQAADIMPFSEAGSVKIVVAHSLGLHFLPDSVLKTTNLLILAAAFADFHSGTVLEQKRSRRTINLMSSRLEETPLDVLNEFYSNCYHPLLTSHLLLMRNLENLNQEQLENDLHLLNTARFDLSRLKQPEQVLFLHGSEDRIVAPSQSHEMHQSVEGSSLILFEGAGHSLPLTHVAPVWISLRNTIRHLLTVNA